MFTNRWLHKFGVCNANDVIMDGGVPPAFVPGLLAPAVGPRGEGPAWLDTPTSGLVSGRWDNQAERPGAHSLACAPAPVRDPCRARKIRPHAANKRKAPKTGEYLVWVGLGGNSSGDPQEGVGNNEELG